MKDAIFTILTTLCKYRGQMLLNKTWVEVCRKESSAVICSEENCFALIKIRQKI